MDKLTSLMVNSLLNKKEAILTKSTLSHFRVLGIDEAGLSDSLGSVFVGFYIETDRRKHPYVKDSKKLNGASLLKRSKTLKGYSLVKQIRPQDFTSYKRGKFLITRTILEGLGEIPVDLYDVIVIDGHPGILDVAKLQKPVIYLTRGDEKVYEVAVASIKAKECVYKERQDMGKALCKDLKVDFNLSGKSCGEHIYRLLGPIPIFKFAYILYRFKKYAQAEWKKSMHVAKQKIRLNLLDQQFTAANTWTYRKNIVTLIRQALDNLKNKYIIANYRAPKLYVSNGTLFCRIPVQQCVAEKFYPRFLNICKLEVKDEGNQRD